MDSVPVAGRIRKKAMTVTEKDKCTGFAPERNG